MDDNARKEKNRTIKEKGKATRLCHSSMRPLVVELKLDLKCLNNSERNNLWMYFTQCCWLCNYLISLDADAFKSFNTRTRNITSLDKDGNTIDRELTMPGSSSRVCILPLSRIWHLLPQSGRRQKRRMES